MRLNITRQPLVPAFMTLFAFAAVTVGVMGRDIAPTEAVEAGITAAKQITEGLVVRTPETLISAFQASFPGWSRFLVGFLILFTGMCVGRMTVRYGLYGVSTCLAIPLYGAVAAGAVVGTESLNGFLAAAFMALAVKNFARSFCNGHGFDAIFRASVYLGLSVLTLPAALPLLLLLPLATVLYRRTLREMIVGLVGMLLAPFALCYANWAWDGSFLAPAIETTARFLSGVPLNLFFGGSHYQLVMTGAILLLNLLSLFIFLSNVYIVGTKPRLILVNAACTLLLTAALLAGPAASPTLMALLAIPSAIVLPVLFVRINSTIASVFYLILLATAFCCIFVQ